MTQWRELIAIPCVICGLSLVFYLAYRQVKDFRNGVGAIMFWALVLFMFCVASYITISHIDKSLDYVLSHNGYTEKGGRF